MHYRQNNKYTFNIKGKCIVLEFIKERVEMKTNKGNSLQSLSQFIEKVIATRDTSKALKCPSKESWKHFEVSISFQGDFESQSMN